MRLHVYEDLQGPHAIGLAVHLTNTRDAVTREADKIESPGIPGFFVFRGRRGLHQLEGNAFAD